MMVLNQGFKLCNILMKNECLLEGVFDTIIYIYRFLSLFFSSLNLVLIRSLSQDPFLLFVLRLVRLAYIFGRFYTDEQVRL